MKAPCHDLRIVRDIESVEHSEECYPEDMDGLEVELLCEDVKVD